MIPEIISEYDQEIPQSQTADNPMDTDVRAELMYNLFNKNEPPVFPGTFSYNAAAASNSEYNQIKTVGKTKQT